MINFIIKLNTTKIIQNKKKELKTTIKIKKSIYPILFLIFNFKLYNKIQNLYKYT